MRTAAMIAADTHAEAFRSCMVRIGNGGLGISAAVHAYGQGMRNAGYALALYQRAEDREAKSKAEALREEIALAEQGFSGILRATLAGAEGGL